MCFLGLILHLTVAYGWLGLALARRITSCSGEVKGILSAIASKVSYLFNHYSR